MIALTFAPMKLALFHHALSDAECDQLIELAKPTLKQLDPHRTPQTVYDAAGNVLPNPYKRIYFTTGLSNDVPLVATLNDRFAKLLRCPIVDSKHDLRIIRYQVGDEFSPHVDRQFQPGAHGRREQTTMIMYLNDGCEGGVTRFPRVGLDVYPNKGSVLVFGSHRDGKENPLALHMSPEIKSGEKWIAVKWFLR